MASGMEMKLFTQIYKLSSQYVGDKKTGPKDKIPWVEFNGLTMADSQLIMVYLNKELGVDLNSSLSPEQRALAWGLQKWLEEFTYWYSHAHY